MALLQLGLKSKAFTKEHGNLGSRLEQVALLVSKGHAGLSGLQCYLDPGFPPGLMADMGHVWVSSPAAAAFCVDIYGPCYHRGSFKSCVIKSEGLPESVPPFTGPGKIIPAPCWTLKQESWLLPSWENCPLPHNLGSWLHLSQGAWEDRTWWHGHRRTGSVTHLREATPMAWTSQLPSRPTSRPWVDLL